MTLFGIQLCSLRNMPQRAALGAEGSAVFAFTPRVLAKANTITLMCYLSE